MITEYTIELRMEKSIQRITQPICVRINENETQQIRAKLMYENNPYSIQCDSAELHLLRDDGTWSHMEASVSGSSVTCTIKANQLGKHAQNACAYFFFKKGTQTETTESFQVRIERAAVDTEASDAFFDASMNRIATKWGAYEATAEAQEIARKDAESKRKDAEASRVQAEQSRVQTEQSRVNTEQARVQVEQARADAEQERVQAEQQRKDAESKRTTADQQRTQAESNRANAEQARVQAEQKRVQAENERQSNESTRTSAEQSRQSRFNEMLDAAQNVKFRILSSNEVDSEGKPTITGSSGIIYLVKAQQAQETQANHYNEWIYLEGRWELFGSTAPTAAAIEVADIDKLEQGTTIAGNRVLNATGLSALWSKLQARLQSLQTNIFLTNTTAKQADTTAKEVKNNMDWLVLRQKGDSSNLEEHRVAIATLKDKMASVESKLNDVAAAKKSFRALLIQIRGKADNSGRDWLLITFKNEKGMCTVNMWVDNSNVSQHFAPKNNSLISILGGLAVFIAPFGCVRFDWIISPDYTKTKGSIDCEFINVMLSIPAGISFLRNQNKSFHAQVSYMRDINETDISKLPELLAETNKQLSEQGLIASYELY